MFRFHDSTGRAESGTSSECQCPVNSVLSRDCPRCHLQGVGRATPVIRQLYHFQELYQQIKNPEKRTYLLYCFILEVSKLFHNFVISVFLSHSVTGSGLTSVTWNLRFIIWDERDVWDWLICLTQSEVHRLGRRFTFKPQGNSWHLHAPWCKWSGEFTLPAFPKQRELLEEKGPITSGFKMLVGYYQYWETVA